MSSTEFADPRFVDIDTWSLPRAVAAMLDGQISALQSLQSQIDIMASAADAAAIRLGRLSQQGRLIYAGAGTSGRVAVQDGVELGPTFGWSESRLCYLMAGGMSALAASAEGAEDDAVAARTAVKANGICADDVVIGVAASGRTPFTLSVIEAARSAGALTIAIANNADTPLLTAAEHAILAATGSEVIAGSTRMQAGTAQKVALNTLSTAIMLRLGRVYRGLMVDMVISNDKLLARARRIVQQLSGCSAQKAVAAMEMGDRNIKAAVLIAKGLSPDGAQTLLAAHGGILRSAIKALDGD
ncbi:MAG: N-acetylmuramic acid 6-phosphate etherase [Sphingopyxis sp.]